MHIYTISHTTLIKQPAEGRVLERKGEMFLLLQFSVGILLLLPVFPFIAKYTVQDGSYYFAPNIHPSWVAIAVKHQTDTDEYALGHDIVFTTNHLAGKMCSPKTATNETVRL